jgi:nicotinate-nucleotide pyrophosphorylase
VDEAVRRARAAGAYHRIEAEADTIDDALMIAEAGADIILLDIWLLLRLNRPLFF